MTIETALGEYVSDDSPSEDWDLRGLSSWAMSKFDAHLTQNQLRRMSVAEIRQELMDAAYEQIEKKEMSGLTKFLEPHYAQHRLAECHVLVEGSRWLAYEAAWRGAPGPAAAGAAGHALAAAGRVFAETHQLSGAIGFTREHDLHVFSMRLVALRLELGGLAGHRRALARERWLIAELFEESGRREEAMRWFEPHWGRVGEAVFLAPSYYRRGLLREAAGDVAGARTDFQRFIALWSEADPALSDWVEDARARVAALPGG